MFSKEKFTYDNIEELKQDVGLKVGNVVKLNGYYTAGDGVGGDYVITSDKTLIPLNNGLYAKKIDIDKKGYLSKRIFPTFDNSVMNLQWRRIPGITCTKNGVLIAVSDVRESISDLPSKIKVAIRRSFNQGITWSDLKIIMNLGDENTQGIGDPLIVHNPDTGRTFCFAVNFKTGNLMDPTTEWGFYMTYSDDDGENWSSLTNLSNLAPVNYRVIYNGIGGGTYHNGTIFVPIQCWQGIGEAQGNKSRSGVMISKDNGVSWTVKTLVQYASSECSCTVYNNELYLACKDESYTYGRFLFKSKDEGTTWEEVIQSSYCTSTTGSILALLEDKESRVIVKSEDEGDGATAPRSNMCIKISKDGSYWEKVIHIRDDDSMGYSALTNDKDYLYVAYEGNKYQGILFKRYPINNILNYGTKIRKYNSKLLDNPKMIGDTIYLEDATEVLYLTNGNKVALKKIKSDSIGKRLLVTTTLTNIHFGIETSDGSQDYQIVDELLGAGKHFKLFKDDIIELVLYPDKKWRITNFKQKKIRVIGRAAISGDVLDLSNYMATKIAIVSNQNTKITSIKNVAHRGDIELYAIGDTSLIFETNQYRYLFNKDIKLTIHSIPETSEYQLIATNLNQPLRIIEGNIDFLLEPNKIQKSFKLFDNVPVILMDVNTSTEKFNSEFSYIKLNSKVELVCIRKIDAYLSESKATLSGYKQITNKKIPFGDGHKITLINIRTGIYGYVDEFYVDKQPL